MVSKIFNFYFFLFSPKKYMIAFICWNKDLASRKDTNLVFSRFISRDDVLCYNRTKINSFILKCLDNSQENQPITPKFVLYIEYTLNYSFIHFGMLISCKQESLLISKQATPISTQNTDGKQSLINTNRQHCFQ